jgi:hypothetical protein
MTRMASIETLSAALRTLAAPGMTPKALRDAVRAQYPDASKKEIVRAAFHALIEAHAQDDRALATLHGFALAERAPGDDLPMTIGPRRKRRERQPAAERQARESQQAAA